MSHDAKLALFQRLLSANATHDASDAESARALADWLIRKAEQIDGVAAPEPLPDVSAELSVLCAAYRLVRDLQRARDHVNTFTDALVVGSVAACAQELEASFQAMPRAARARIAALVLDDATHEPQP